MTKKILFTTAIALVTLGITHNIVNAEAQIIIDPVTKTIIITGMTLNTGATTTGTIQTGNINTGTTTTGTVTTTPLNTT